MKMRFWVKFCLFLSILTVPNFLPPAKSIFCPLVAWGYDRSDFGRSGRNGGAGRSGRHGRAGESQSISADGSSFNLNLSGTDGDDGEDGSDGDNALCGRQPYRFSRNIYAASGGHGGRAGDGGNGGDAGLLTVYYSNLAHLKNISVRASGGKGGRAGRAGKGGYGCNCDRRSWEEKTCTGTPGSADYKCQSRRYYCTDGADGRGGTRGREGNNGNLGRLVLINRQEPLPGDTPEITLPLSQLHQKPLSLSKNKWSDRTGATSLLATGSTIANEYQEFDERIEQSFQFVGDGIKLPENSSNQRVTITLQDDKQFKVDFPEEIWVTGRQNHKQGTTKFVVSNLVHQNEVTQLKPVEFSGNGSNLTLTLTDFARKSDIVSTQFWINYRSSPADARFNRFNDFRYTYQTRHEGNIPAQFVSLDNHRFTLNLGKLPIWVEFLQPGVGVEIELVATRSLGERSTTQRITWTGEIPR